MFRRGRRLRPFLKGFACKLISFQVKDVVARAIRTGASKANVAEPGVEDAFPKVKLAPELLQEVQTGKYRHVPIASIHNVELNVLLDASEHNDKFCQPEAFQALAVAEPRFGALCGVKVNHAIEHVVCEVHPEQLIFSRAVSEPHERVAPLSRTMPAEVAST